MRASNKDWSFMFAFIAVFCVFVTLTLTISGPSNPEDNFYFYNLFIPIYMLLAALFFYFSLYYYDKAKDEPKLEDEIARGRVKLTKNFYIVKNTDDTKGPLDYWFIEHNGYYIGVFHDTPEKDFASEEIKRLLISLRIYGLGEWQ